MRSRSDHYAEADRLLEEARTLIPNGVGQNQCLAAIAHAMLAATPHEVYAEVRRAEYADLDKAKRVVKA